MDDTRGTSKPPALKLLTVSRFPSRRCLCENERQQAMRKEPFAAAKSVKTNPAGQARGIVAPSTVRRGSPVTLDDIRTRAYQKWVAAGKPDSDGVRFWLEAEQELLATN
jgi:hypothetical protein